MQNAQSIKGIFIIIFGGLVAIWLGVNVVTSQTDTLLKVVGAVFLIVCTLLGPRIWLLFVFFVSLDIPLIRGIGTIEIGQAAFVGFSLLLFAVRKLKFAPRFGELEFWMLLVSACIVQAYMRNPVGLNILGGGSVGGRPYMVAGLALLSGWLLSTLIVKPSEIKWSYYLTLSGELIGAPLTALRSNAGMAAQGLGQAGLGISESRVAWIGGLALLAIRWVVSRVSPFRALFRPLFLILLGAAVVAAAASGYRNMVATSGLMLIAAIYYYHGLFATILGFLSGAVCIALLSLVNLIAPLPGTMQRALSPFPGTWEERYVRDANHSTDWRVEMWKEALLTDYWIKNKILGDGLGMTSEELERMQDANYGKEGHRATKSGMTLQQEAMMLTGNYHSGPVQTIRTVGYVGLAVILCAMIRLSLHIHRLIKLSRGTEWFHVIFFLGLPALIYPIEFTFIYGDFKAAMSILFYSFGVIRLLERNLPLAQPMMSHIQVENQRYRPGRLPSPPSPAGRPIY